MERKNIILISISVVLFGVAGYVLYTGIFSRTASVVTETPNLQNTQDLSAPLLPYGTSLDFGALERRQDAEKPYEYQLVNPETEVGVDIAGLIRNTVQIPPGSPQQLTRPVDNSDRLLQRQP